MSRRRGMSTRRGSKSTPKIPPQIDRYDRYAGSGDVKLLIIKESYLTEKDVPPVIPHPRRLPFGIYAIVFFLVLHIAGLLFDVLAIRYELGIEFIDSISTVIFEEFGLGGLFQILFPTERALAIANITLVVLFCILIAGLLAKVRWAWVATMLLIGISLLVGILDYANDEPRYLNMLVGVIIVFYLNERSVQYAYERKVRREGETG